MPTYQYACTECDEQLEVRQSFTDDALTVCPACEGRLRKIFNAVGVVFKGSGFYKTDSRKQPSHDSGSSGSSSGSSSTSGSSDSSGGSGSGNGSSSTSGSNGSSSSATGGSSGKASSAA